MNTRHKVQLYGMLAGVIILAAAAMIQNPIVAIAAIMVIACAALADIA